MIFIDQGESNTIILTLTEHVTISSPTFVFKFIYEGDVTDVAALYWVGSDESIWTERYNKFTLVEGTDVTFRLGQYIYEVYESNGTPSPLNEDGLDLLESGMLKVSGTRTTVYD